MPRQEGQTQTKETQHKPYVLEYRVIEGDRGTSYRFLEVAKSPSSSILFMPESQARKVISTPLGDASDDKRDDIIVTMEANAYGRLASKFPKGKVVIDLPSAARRGTSSIATADELAQSYLQKPDTLLHKVT